MRKTRFFIAAFAACLTVIVGVADTQDSWRMKMSMGDGSVRTLILDALDSIVIGDAEKMDVKPGDVDAAGNPMLMKVEYTPYYEWSWYHDNLSNSSRPRVERKEIYSDGTQHCDTLYDYGHPTSYIGRVWGCRVPDYKCSIRCNERGVEEKMSPCDFTFWPVWTVDDPNQLIQYVENGEIPSEGERVIYNCGNTEYRRTDEGITNIINHSIGVDYLNGLYIDYDERPNPGNKYGNWSAYTESRLFYEMDSDGNSINPSSYSLGIPLGYYYSEIQVDSELYLRRLGCPEPHRSFIIIDSNFDDYDQFLHVDDRIVDFLDLKFKCYTKKPTLEPITCDRGDCLLLKYEQRFEKCGKFQELSVTDTIYEIKYDQPVLRYITYMEIDHNGGLDGSCDFAGEESSRTYSIVSSLKPEIAISGEGFSVDIVDCGEDPDHTNRSLPFHKWEIVVTASDNDSGDERKGTMKLLDAWGKVLQTLDMTQYKKW